MKKTKVEYDEFDEGTILRECPECGQFCRIPKYYTGSHKGSYAISYCKRCKKKVKLGVIYE